MAGVVRCSDYVITTTAMLLLSHVSWSARATSLTLLLSFGRVMLRHLKHSRKLISLASKYPLAISYSISCNCRLSFIWVSCESPSKPGH